MLTYAGAALCRDSAVLLEGPAASGKSRMVLHVAEKLGKGTQFTSFTGTNVPILTQHALAAAGLIRIHLDDQMDSKTLLGSYVCTDTPGEFLWQPGALTQAVQQGRCVLIENLHLC